MPRSKSIIPPFSFLAEPPPTMPKAALEAGKDWLKDNKEEFSFTTNFAFISKEGDVQDFKGQPCHGSMPRSKPTHRIAVATEIAIARPCASGKKDSEEYNPFLRWFLNDSIFSPFIETRDDFNFCRNYGIVVSGHAPQPIMQAIMIISRHFRECRLVTFTKFNELCQAGAEPFLAYGMCFNTSWSTCDAGRKQDLLASPVTSKGGHRAFPSFSLEMLQNYYAGKVFGHGMQDSFIESASLYGVARMFQQSEEAFSTGLELFRVQSKEYHNAVLAFRKDRSKTEGYRPPNPFAAQPMNGGGSTESYLTYDEYFTFLIPYLVEKGIVNGQP